MSANFRLRFFGAPQLATVRRRLTDYQDVEPETAAMVTRLPAGETGIYGATIEDRATMRGVGRELRAVMDR